MIECLFLDTDEKRYFAPAARALIAEIAHAAEIEIRAWLPDLPATLQLAVQTGEYVIPETGEVGAALSKHRVRWVVDPARRGGIEAIARARLRSALHHELHHVVRGWLMEASVPARMIDAAVSEGLATAFERDAAGSRPLWGEYPPAVSGWVRELQQLPRTAHYQTWMLKHPDGRRWIGYRAGTYIADRAIAHSGRSAAELVHAPADELLALARLE